MNRRTVLCVAAVVGIAASSIAACVDNLPPGGDPIDAGGETATADNDSGGGDDGGSGTDGTVATDGGGSDAGPATFALVKPMGARLLRSNTTQIDVTVNRNAFPADIDVTLTGMPTGVTVSAPALATVTLSAGQTVAHFPLEATINADLGPAMLHVAAASTGRPKQSSDFGLLVSDPPGTIDLTFGLTGVISRSGAHANALSVGKDGSVVVAGSDGSGAILVRYNALGVEDTAFGTEAAKHIPTGGQINGVAERIVNSTNPQVVIAGKDDGGSGHFFVMVLNQSGTVDNTFASGGFVLQGSIGVASAVAVDSLQRVVAIGFNSSSNGPLGRRFKTDGMVDKIMSFPAIPAAFSGMVLIPKALVIGTADDVWVGGTLGTGPSYAFVAHLDANLNVDTAFGDNGIIVTGMSGNYNEGWAVARFPTGEIGLAGSDGLPNALFGVYRPPAEALLGGDAGVLTFKYSAYHFGLHGAAMQSDGKIVLVGGYGTATKENPYFERRFVDGGVDHIGEAGAPRIQYINGTPSSSEWRAVAMSPEGRIVVAGVDDSGWIVARYWP